MTSHTDRHEDLVRDVVVGDLSPDDPAVLERLATCPRCARLLDGARRAMALLEHDAAEQDELLELAARVPDAPLDSVDAMRDHPEIRGSHAAGRPDGAGNGPRGLAAGLAAALALAAAVLAMFLVLQRDAPEAAVAHQPRMLGTRADLELIEPRGEVPAFETFSWHLDPELESAVAYYVVFVQEAGQPAREVKRTREVSWNPGTQKGQLPSAFEWWVEAHSGTDVLARSDPAAVRRSP